MSFMTVIKGTIDAGVALAKENPLAAVAVVAGSALVGYGGYKGVQRLRSEKKPVAEAVAQVGQTAKPQVALAVVGITKEQAEKGGLVKEWDALAGLAEKMGS